MKRISDEEIKIANRIPPEEYGAEPNWWLRVSRYVADAQLQQDCEEHNREMRELFEEIEGELNIEYLIRAKGSDISSMTIISNLKRKMQSLKERFGGK